MDINSLSGVSPILYTRGATLANNTSGNSQATVSKETSLAASYSVSLSSEGIDRSKALFESGQASDLRSFERSQDRKEQTKERELDAEKSQFDRQQASEKRQFEAEQRLEKMKFAQQKSLS